STTLFRSPRGAPASARPRGAPGPVPALLPAHSPQSLRRKLRLVRRRRAPALGAVSGGTQRLVEHEPARRSRGFVRLECRLQAAPHVTWVRGRLGETYDATRSRRQQTDEMRHIAHVAKEAGDE